MIPEEGTTAWADHWVLTKGAKNLDAAYAWLEYTSQPFTQKLLADVTNYIVANPAAKGYMSPEQVATQRDIADYGTRVNFWQWSPRREKYTGDLERGEGGEVARITRCDAVTPIARAVSTATHTLAR